VRFFEVSEGELEELRERFKNGQYSIDIEHKTFSMAEYNDMLASEWRCCCVAGLVIMYAAAFMLAVMASTSAVESGQAAAHTPCMQPLHAACHVVGDHMLTCPAPALQLIYCCCCCCGHGHTAAPPLQLTVICCT
jgi:hypothetical protein